MSIPLTRACDRRSSTVPLRHSSALLFAHRGAGALQRLAVLHQPLGRVRPAVEQHVLDQHLQLRVDLFVHLEHARVHDAHVHAGRDGVIQKRGVHGLANLVVAAKAEGDVGDAAAHLGVRQVGLDPTGGVDKVNRVVVVLLHARGHGEDVGIEDDVFRGKANLIDQNPVGTLADADLIFVASRPGPAHRRPSPPPLRRTSAPWPRCGGISLRLLSARWSSRCPCPAGT